MATGRTRETAAAAVGPAGGRPRTSPRTRTSAKEIDLDSVSALDLVAGRGPRTRAGRGLSSPARAGIACRFAWPCAPALRVRWRAHLDTGGVDHHRCGGRRRLRWCSPLAARGDDGRPRPHGARRDRRRQRSAELRRAPRPAPRTSGANGSPLHQPGHRPDGAAGPEPRLLRPAVRGPALGRPSDAAEPPPSVGSGSSPWPCS